MGEIFHARRYIPRFIIPHGLNNKYEGRLTFIVQLDNSQLLTKGVRINYTRLLPMAWNSGWQYSINQSRYQELINLICAFDFIAMAGVLCPPSYVPVRLLKCKAYPAALAYFLRTCVATNVVTGSTP